MRSYKQLSLDERYQIQAGRRAGWTIPKIAASIGRHPSTVYRELERNRHAVVVTNWVAEKPQPWLPELAHRRARLRREKKGEAQRKIKGELQELVEAKLRLSWSPEQISGRLKAERGISLC